MNNNLRNNAAGASNLWPSQSAEHPNNNNQRRHRRQRHRQGAESLGIYDSEGRPLIQQPAVVHFDESQLAMFATQNANANQMAGLKDELALAAGKVTPGVDDTPYIQYAIEAVTGGQGQVFDPDELDAQRYRREKAAAAAAAQKQPQEQQQQHTDTSAGYPPAVSYPGNSRRVSLESPRRTPVSEDENFRTLSPVSSRVHTPMHAVPPPQPRRVQQQAPPPAPVRSDPEMWVPVTPDMRRNLYPSEKTTAYPPLTFKPRLLRPYSLIILITLCLLMVAALIGTVIYSHNSDGLTPYPGTIYSGHYFLFRILPQLLAALILIYAQATAAASLHTLPFASMASEDARQRYLSLFRDLYPSTFLWPRPLYGPWQVKVFAVAVWLTLFTVPLQSTLFTCILVDGTWTWAATTAVAWTLVALYLILVVASAILMVFWFRRWTGLQWHVRSIADMVTLVNRSNTIQAYGSADTTTSANGLRDTLRDQWFDRLGYWTTDDTPGSSTWYGIGSSGTSDHDAYMVSELMGKRTSRRRQSVDFISGFHTPYQYLPWCLRSGPVIAFAAVSFALLLALLIVSFLPQTRLERGFLPLIAARPSESGAFSAANFLYSFIPSLLGMLLFLLLQSIDQALRMVQPWGELFRTTGGVARKSILADYATCCHPLEASLRAARVGHWRVAVISLLTALSLAIPVLAGGLFMALTTSAGEVRMFPNIPVYGVLLALLFLYLGAMSLLLPRRGRLRLPHTVSCLAGVLSLCAAEELTRDEAFRAVRSRDDLQTRLGVYPGADPREESVWFFGLVPGRDEQRLSVRRLRRFTEKMSAARGFTSMV